MVTLCRKMVTSSLQQFMFCLNLGLLGEIQKISSLRMSLLQMGKERRPSVLFQQRWFHGFKALWWTAQVGCEDQSQSGSSHGAIAWLRGCFQLGKRSSLWTPSRPWLTAIHVSSWQWWCFPTDRVTSDFRPSSLMYLCFLWLFRFCVTLLLVSSGVTAANFAQQGGATLFLRQEKQEEDDDNDFEVKELGQLHEPTKKISSSCQLGHVVWLIFHGGSQTNPGGSMDAHMVTVEDEDDEDDKKQDSAELVLHEFVYKLKSYFLESERALRVPGLLKKWMVCSYPLFPSMYFSTLGFQSLSSLMLKLSHETC